MTKINILFICHGNICRSTMAQFVFQDMINRAGLCGSLLVESAATSREEIDNPPHRGTVKKLTQAGVPVLRHYAVQMTYEDYFKYDYLIGMDDWNIKNMKWISCGDPEGKMCKLLDFSENPRDIADPWYTGNYDATYEDIREGCEGLLAYLINEHQPTHLSVFSEHKDVRGFFSTKYASVAGAPYDNKELFEELGVADAMKVWPKQVHKTEIAVIRERLADSPVIQDTDGAITDVPGVLLTTVHADCLPVYFYDPVHRAIGLVHAGWRGTDAGIAPKCLELMMQEYGTDPAAVKVHIGPGISQCCFEVGPEVRNQFAEHWAFADEYAVKKGEKFYLDIKGINRRELIEAGVLLENITVSEHCTYHEPDLFVSYRREGGTTARMGAGLMIRID